jgi:bifunctional non-homologous end joining protein LigD
MAKTQAKVKGRELRLSNLDKVLYPEVGFTKGQVIDYYRRVAPVLLPHLRDRALTLKRYPNGVEGKFFYEKNCPSHRPDWVETARIYSRHNKAHIAYCVAEDEPTLVWVAQLACLELHTSLALVKDVARPTMMVFDLDPGEPASLLDCMRIGLRVRDVFKHLGLECFAKTSGGKGLHVYVPLNMAVTYDETKAFSNALARLMERENPDAVTSNMRKDLRKGKVFMDWSQNDQHKTTVCVYSLRARARPTVSMPVTWREIATAVRKDDPASLVFEADAALRRISRRGDLFAPMLKLKQKLPRFDA